MGNWNGGKELHSRYFKTILGFVLLRNSDFFLLKDLALEILLNLILELGAGDDMSLPCETDETGCCDC